MTDDMGLMVMAFLGTVFVCGLLGMACAAGKGNGGTGMLLGMLLGPLGILIAVLLPAAERPPVVSAGARKAQKKLASFAARRGDPLDEWEAAQRRR